MNMAQAVKRCAMEAVEASFPSDVFFGTVISEEPLEVRCGELQLKGELIQVAEGLKRKEATIHFTTYDKVVVINEGIKKNDRLILLRKAGGECYVAVGKL